MAEKKLVLRKARFEKEKICRHLAAQESQPEVVKRATSKPKALAVPPPARKNEDVYWLALTDQELRLLRKRMKKGATWIPSNYLMEEDLKRLGRGIEAYRAAQTKAGAARKLMR
jgi:hypothetical protein